MEAGTKRLRKRMRRFFLTMAVTLPLFGVLILALELWVVLSVKPRILNADEIEEPAECIIVLGCGLDSEGRPGRHLSLRMDTAIALYRQGAAPRLLVSGDHSGDNYDEVNAMKRYAVEHGVPAEAVFMDHAGYSTYETMVRAAKKFGCRKVIVVTQEFHIYRSVYDAVKNGIDAIGVCSGDCREAYSPRYNLYLDLREVLARCKDLFCCTLHTAVPEMGEAVDMSGSGQITDDSHTEKWMTELTNNSPQANAED